MEPPLLQTFLQTLTGALQSELSVQGLNAALQVRITGAMDTDSFSSMHTYPDQIVWHTIRPQCAHSALGMLIIPNYLWCIAIHSDKLLIIQPWEPPVCRTLGCIVEELVIKPWMCINNQCYFMCIILIIPSSLLFSPRQFPDHIIFITFLDHCSRDLWGTHPLWKAPLHVPHHLLPKQLFSHIRFLLLVLILFHVHDFPGDSISKALLKSRSIAFKPLLHWVHSKLVKNFATERFLLKEKTLKMCCKAHTCNFDLALNIKMFPSLTGTLFYILN